MSAPRERAVAPQAGPVVPPPPVTPLQKLALDQLKLVGIVSERDFMPIAYHLLEERLRGG